MNQEQVEARVMAHNLDAMRLVAAIEAFVIHDHDDERSFKDVVKHHMAPAALLWMLDRLTEEHGRHLLTDVAQDFLQFMEGPVRELMSERLTA